MYNGFNGGRPSFFQGRNGSDQLSVFLAGIAFLLVIIYPLFSMKEVQFALTMGAFLIAALSIFRMLSKNIAKRRTENEVFLRIFSRSGKRAKREGRRREKLLKKERKERRKEDLKTHVYYRCPECDTELRVPRGKGKIRIKCPKGSTQFIKKT